MIVPTYIFVDVDFFNGETLINDSDTDHDCLDPIPGFSDATTIFQKVSLKY